MTLEKPQQLKDIDTLKQDIVNLNNNKAERNDTYTKTEVNNSLGLKADKTTTYTKTETDNLLGNKANKADTYIKSEIDNSMANKTNNIVGQIIYVATPTAPDGWLKCDGSAVSRTTYANLFTAIGTTYGSGNGTTTFNLPDVRGEFIRGWDDGRGVDTGRTLGSKQTDSLKSHTHNLTVRDGATSFGSDLALTKASGSGGTNMSQSVDETGGTETRPRNIAFLVCIKY